MRRINDLVDFSFIRKELTDKYSLDNGRMAESPVVMFKYLLLKTVYDISDVDVVERSRYDMSFKYFLGMSPENTDLINPSTLCKFRKLRLKDKDLLNMLIGKTVGIAVEKGIIRWDSGGKRHNQVPHDNSRRHPHMLKEQPLFPGRDIEAPLKAAAQEPV